MKPEYNRRQISVQMLHRWKTHIIEALQCEKHTQHNGQICERVGTTDHSGSYHNHLQSIRGNSEVRCLCRAQRILKGNTHPATVCSPCCHLEKHTWKRSIQYNPRRLLSSFFPPAVRLLNSSSLLYHGFYFLWQLVTASCIILCISEL